MSTYAGVILCWISSDEGRELVSLLSKTVRGVCCEINVTGFISG
jgi:hypothetical protein